MPIRERIAIQTEGFSSITSLTATPIPGMILTVKAHSTFYLDIRMRVSAPGSPTGFTVRVDGWNFFSVYPNQSVLNWQLETVNPALYFKGFPQSEPSAYEWVFDPSAVTPNAVLTLYATLYIYGLIQNTTDTDQDIVVSMAKLGSSPGAFLQVEGGRMLLYENTGQFPSQNTTSDMTQCGCCVTATISCCQTAITINTINPDTDFTWKIIDFLNGVYTGTMTTDATGVGTITVGDGMDLPDGFLDAIGSFKIEFVDNRPAIASKMDCIEVDIVGGAYLALTDIGEPLP